ncbi:MAG TPA: ABC transporter permease [Opitutaceae bacterium]|nr:ABC transporter permease [Opitutaceae bacterium]
MISNLRFAFRQFRKAPGFSAVVVLTLAIGLGANTAIFGIVNATFLRALPYPEPGRLVQVFETSRQWPTMSVSYPNFLDWQASQDVFEGLAIYRSNALKVDTPNGVERASVGYVSADFFRILGVRAALGRDLAPDDDREGAAPAAWLSHAFWQRSFAGAADLVGRTILLDNEPVAVAGILPASYRFHQGTDLVVPVAPYAGRTFLKMRGNHNGTAVIARLKPGVTIEAARTQLAAIAERLARDYPNDNAGISAGAASLHEQFSGGSRNNLLLLFGAVGMILLIACVNIANMLLARAGSREREMAIRTSLGATRGILVRQLLTESIVLSAAGGLLGLLLGAWGCDIARRLMPWELQSIYGGDIGLDLRVLAFSALLALGTGLAFGLLPALRLARNDPNDALKNSTHFVRTRFGRFHIPDLLVVAQVGLALMLLVGAGLMIRSLWLLSRIPPGLAPEHLLTLRVSAPSMEEYRKSPLAFAAFHERIVEAVQALPEVESAAFGSSLPFTWDDSSNVVFPTDRPPPAPEDLTSVYSHVITPDYFQAMGVPILRGHGFDGHEPQPSMPPDLELTQDSFVEIYRNFDIQCVISQRLAEQLWPGEDALGKQFQMGQPSLNLPRFRVIGIAGNTTQHGLDAGASPEYYTAIRQFPMPMSYCLVVRTRNEPTALVGSLRTVLKSVAPQESMYDVRLMSDRIAERSSGRRFNTGVFAFFGGIGLLLSAIGIYGVLAFNVGRRTREIGIRMALGAQPLDVLREVLRSGLLLVVAGAVIGGVGAFAGARLLQSQLFGVSGVDFYAYLAATLPLLLVAFVACLIPARRATRVDPLIALRSE